MTFIFHRILALTVCTWICVPVCANKWEMLARENSSVSLFCDAIFKQGYTTAVWYKDGKKLGEVDDTTNLLIGVVRDKVAQSLESIPDLGFLIIASVTKSDEGVYSCYNTESKSSSSTKSYSPRSRDIRVRVAFLMHKFKKSPGWSVAQIGDSVTLQCSPPFAYPIPTVSWSKDGQHVYKTGRVQINIDGRLVINDVRPADGGEYSCWARNVVGHRKVKGYLLTDSEVIHAQPSISKSELSTRWLLWGHLLWFLVGMVLTASILLLYALFAVTCLRPGRPNAVRPCALDAPAFTKLAQPILPVRV